MQKTMAYLNFFAKFQEKNSIGRIGVPEIAAAC